MLYVDCRNATPGASGAACQKSCHALDMDCYSTKCEPGCVCPDGLVASGDGGCVPVSACPCVHNEASYQPGQTIHVGCNTCTCQSGTWQCTDQPCLATCTVYGDGHYLTFDGRRYSFSGDCEYTLLQDHCGGNGSTQDSFRVVTENVPCGTTGTTCSKAIKIFLGSYELKLSDRTLEVIETGPRPPYSIHQMGIYLVVDTELGLTLLWDKGTSIFLRLSPEFKGRVCGLCGNFDDNALNDFTTRSQSVVGDVLEFGNSWKFSPSCPDALAPRDPCTANPYRRSWAQKQCSIINSATFSACHAHVEPARYYEACVSDACACDSGGDCECFCTAVAAYAQACHDAGVCVSWRTPDTCPLFCDYYNPQGQCEWHYQPCGAPCLKTCQNPSGQCWPDTRGLEGCYPKCPPEAPIFDEDQMQCVASCPTPSPQPPCHVGGQSFWPNSTVPSDRNCYSWPEDARHPQTHLSCVTSVCTKGGVQCAYDANACVCTYDGRPFHSGDAIYHTTDGLGGCISAHCGANGTIERTVYTCSPATPAPQTTFSFSTSLPAPRPSEWSSPEPTTVTCLQVLCNWTEWMDGSYPGPGRNSGDFDTISNLRAEGYKFCAEPRSVQCRAERFPDTPLQELGQDVVCNKSVGLICWNKDQLPPICYNYNVRFLCCELVDTCRTNTASPATPAATRTATAGASSAWATGALSTSTKLSTASSPHMTPTRRATPSTHEQSSPGTTPCKPKCRWTKWFDVDFPMPGPRGGDNETFSNIMRNGDPICHRSESISKVECRAENHPGVSIHELGQLVQCHQDVGLLCRNQDQKGKTRLCLNYQIRVLCCEPQEHCSPATVTVTSTSSKGETWPMPNCSEATCQGNGVITVSPRRCPRVQKPTCANGYPAVQVADRDGCCPHYQCQCVCSGWGDPHYITFDGTYYTFLDNCTYVLVQQIVPVYGHFRVLVENYFCNSEDGLSCPQSIIVEYRENRVVLVRRPVHGVMTNEIIFNGEVVRPGFQKGGIAVSQVGIKMYVSIPELGVWVMFSGLIFSVEVPFSKFANNTEGQCGTCTNDQKDECRLPGGEVVASCSNMSSHWKVAYPGQPPCNGPPPTPTPVEPRTSPTPCPPSPICQLILSKPFELCHVLIPPWPYYQGCTFDRCHMPGTDVVCSALELYAALCASLGVCIDWRGQTNYTCPFTCPAGMEYRPCGPPSSSYCYMNSSASPLALLEPSPITEGCFCPQGTMLYSSSKEVCVPTDCNACLGPSGEPVEPGHTVSVDCQECTCEGGTQTMSCRPRTCPPAPACPASGQVPVPEAMQTGQCCPQYRCACDIRHCPEPEACPKGSHAIQTYREAACCPAYSCSWTVCSINGTLYQPGAVVSSSLCEKCWCELPGGASSDTFSINCETQICGTSCPLGFKYQARAGQCCGECVQVACVINTSNSSVHLFYPGESWSDPGDHCISHECERHQDGLVVVTTKKACPPLNCSAKFHVYGLIGETKAGWLRKVGPGAECSPRKPGNRPRQRAGWAPLGLLSSDTSAVSAAHGGRVCSTWGDFHYKTFDGDVFRFPGLCNYVFSAHCGSAYEDFNLQLRRGLLGSRPTITHIVLRSQGLVLEVSNGSVLINGWREELPYSRAGLLVERSSAYVKINIRLMLTFMWNGEDSALLELDPKYANQTCGLCGDFNGLRAVSEFYTHNARLSPLQFGNLQKLDGPTEQCQDPLPSPAADNCTDEEGVCRSTLLGPAFAPCHGLVDAEVYVAACTQDLCRCPTCPCATFAEYSRQCAHAGGQPQNWRGPDLCHTVLDDVTHTGCLPLRQCPCTHGGRIYAPGASFNTSCSSCTCSGGLWQCQDLPCPGTCSVQGGSHISTYDEKLYDVHGDCSYVLTKVCADSALTVLADLRKCGLTDNENCLKTVTLSLNGGDTTVQIQANGGVFVNSIYTQLPVSVADVTVFRPSSFFILVQTGPWLQLQVQLAPLMQVFLRLDPAYRGRMCGLCGNFNQNQADDFRTVGGVVEATAAAFANTWKTQAACPNVKNSFEDPCSLSVENENYARHWCSLLTRPAGPFSPCHSVVSPGPFHSNCLFDTCNCEKSEDCMCAALSSYVWACAARGVLLRGWRDGVCTKYASSCPKTQSYAHVVDSCQPTCRSLSQPDVSCDVAFVPVDGCVCPQGTFLDDAGDCVPAEACPCYLGGTVVAPGEVVHDSGVVCSCVSGRLSCLGATEQSTGCVAPMVFLDCSNASADAPGAECVRSCHTLDVDCFSTHCVSGCVCPVGLLSDGSGGCVAKEDCPCVHNEAAYKPGQVIKVDCNTCTCRGRRWECSDRPCLGTCVAYGDGHFLTFDGERYGFEGSCEYTLAQDYCVGGDTANGTFRIVTENVPCGTTGVTCSKAIKIFLGSYELILHEGTHRVLQRGPGGDLPYRVRYMGVYLTVETHSGVVVSWDRKTSVIIRLRHEYKGRVCGLCGNFDDNALNDFTTRSQSVVGDVLEFGNSWKFSPSCPDALAPRDPCTANPYRRSWAQKQCSIINSATFSACRSQVDSTRYYEACVSDACACDSGADCECFCTAVAAYAQACHEAGVCVSWRTPDVCPLFCDYYNPHGECEWHYQPCGVPCLKTCRNPSGLCLMDLPGLEGCYPECPPSKPLFNEDRMECVAQCSGCYDRDGNYYDVGTRVPTTENCQSCACTSSGLQCTHSPEACTCTYEGRTYAYGDVIYNTTDGLGACLIAICRDNGTIVRRAMECPGTPSITPFTFTSTAAPPSTTGLPVVRLV
ncbi:hypothetical protein JEQ12_011394 [Ovis aries]|uniref:Mucin-5AC n=1 Tax=Ovis aries TaxID=9940 RepID=A0A835ZN43_SHEEP|nr:hypothetical protein JEQ12_011394 [Ovis aries]